MIKEPLSPRPGEVLAAATAQDILDSPAYAEELSALPEEYREAAAAYFATIAGIPDTLSGFDADTYEEKYLDQDEGPYIAGPPRTPDQLREHALQIITMVNGCLAAWERAVEGLALACYPPCPSEAAVDLLQRSASAFYSELVRQRTEQHTWFLRDAGLSLAPRPPVEGDCIWTSGGYVPVAEHLLLHG